MPSGARVFLCPLIIYPAPMPELTPLSPPSAWVTRWLPAVPQGGTLLDVACGRGRHIGAAVERGYRVTAIDRDQSANAFAGNAAVELIEADLETPAGWPLGGRRFDGVIVVNYLHRPILAAIAAAVSPAGALLYETFAVGNEAFGRPRNPDFLLRPGELLTATAPALMPIAFETVRLTDPDRLVQRLLAVGPGHAWLSDPSSQPSL